MMILAMTLNSFNTCRYELWLSNHLNMQICGMALKSFKHADMSYGSQLLYTNLFTNTIQHLHCRYTTTQSKSWPRQMTSQAQDPTEYKSNMELKINNTALPMATHRKIMGLTLDPKLTYSTNIQNISVQTHKPLQMIKATG